MSEKLIIVFIYIGCELLGLQFCLVLVTLKKEDFNIVTCMECPQTGFGLVVGFIVFLQIVNASTACTKTSESSPVVAS
jgi:hypothetical protein